MQQIQPQPIPVLWGFDATPDGEQCVVVAQHFLGTSVFHISYENLPNIIQALAQQKERLDEIRNNLGIGEQGKLAIPSKVVFGPDGQPLSVVPPSAEVQEQERLHSVPPADDEDAGRRGD